MIVKFDHISYSCKTALEEEVYKSFDGYEAQFHEVDLKNLPMKYAYMHNPQEKHNIMLLAKQGSYPIEITAYENCLERDIQKESKYVLKEELIEIYSENPEKTEEFFKLLGMKEGDKSVLEMKPFLDEKLVRIKVCKAGGDNSIRLDEEGFGSLAFVVDNAKKQKQLLLDNGYECTEIEELQVNGKNLKIFFTNSLTNEIIEFIGLR